MTALTVMEGLDMLMENLRPFIPLLGYAILRVAEVATSRWTWIGLLFIILFSLWGFRGVKIFQIGFSWWGKQAKVWIMLQFFSSSASNHTAARKNNTAAFADDNLNLSLCRTMCMDDFHVFTYTGSGVMERGIYTRRSKNRSKSSSIIDSLTLCSSVESMDNSVEVGSECFLQTQMLFTFEKSSSLSVAKSVSSALRFGEKELESQSSYQQLDCLSSSLIRLPNHEKLSPDHEFEEPMQDHRGKSTFSSYFLYDEKCKGNYKGSLFIVNDGERRGKQPGPCFLDSCVDIGVWRRLESFEIQFGFDRLQSLRLGYGFNWNCCTGTSGLNLDKFSKYLVRDISVTNNPKRSLVKLFSLQEKSVSSVDIAWNMGLSSTCPVFDNSTVCLWDIEVGKCLTKMVVDDQYAIVGSHIENSSGSLFSAGIMIREEKASLFVWDPRDFSFQPLNFSVGNLLTIHSVQFNDNKVCVSDCFTEKLFDSRMNIAGSSPIEVMPSKAISFHE